MSQRSLNGCRFEQSLAPAPKLNADPAVLKDLPRHVDLRAHCSPVEDQKHTESCTANAIVGALELHQKKAGLPVTDMSRLFLFYNSRAMAKEENNPSTGSYIHHGMAAVMAFGVCEERMWPFEEAMVTAKPTDACYQNAEHYNAVQFARTPYGESAWAALAQGLPVAFGIYAPRECYDGAEQTGVMPVPNVGAGGPPQSGHAMLIVGYDLDDKAYLVRNSWGPDWGNKGYCTIPFEVMDKFAHADQFWTIGAIEQSHGLGMFGPSVNETVKQVTDQIGGPSALDALRVGLRQDLNSRLDEARAGFRDRLRGL